MSKSDLLTICDELFKGIIGKVYKFSPYCIDAVCRYDARCHNRLDERLN